MYKNTGLRLFRCLSPVCHVMQFDSGAIFLWFWDFFCLLAGSCPIFPWFLGLFFLLACSWPISRDAACFQRCFSLLLGLFCPLVGSCPIFNDAACFQRLFFSGFGIFFALWLASGPFSLLSEIFYRFSS